MHGHVLLMYRVGVCRRDGVGCDRDYTLALESFQAAASQGLSRANVALLDLMMEDANNDHQVVF
jgi:TPR repeat protein